jgi:hypothetical protein
MSWRRYNGQSRANNLAYFARASVTKRNVTLTPEAGCPLVQAPHLRLESSEKMCLEMKLKRDC